MRIDYKKELETAAHQMILIHDVNILIKLILRIVLKNIKVKHAGIFFYQRNRDEYLVTVSRGEKGFKVPAGFAKIGKSNPIVRYFNEKDKLISDEMFLTRDGISAYLRKNQIKKNRKLRFFFEELKFQMSLLQARAYVAGYFRDRLLGVLFLGEKINKDKFRIEELKFLSALASDVVMAIQNAWLFEDLKANVDRNRRLFLNTVKTLTATIEAKDRYTLGHTERVTLYSLVLFDEIQTIRKIPSNLNSDLKEKLRVASLLHDIGKIGISEDILNKQGPLSKEERKQIEKHPLLGFGIIRPIEEFKEISEAVRHHHERFDGRGYPEGIKGKKIPLLAAIISVADAYDAMTTQRPYRKALSREEALGEIIKQNRKQFHPSVVKSFLRAYKKGRL